MQKLKVTIFQLLHQQSIDLLVSLKVLVALILRLFNVARRGKLKPEHRN